MTTKIEPSKWIASQNVYSAILSGDINGGGSLELGAWHDGFRHSSYMIIEPDLITFPTYKIYPELDIGELEEIIYYDDEIIEYEPEVHFLAKDRGLPVDCEAHC